MSGTDTGREPLTRPTDSRMLAGVAAGVARYLNVDVAIVRIAFVIIAIVTQGLGILAYIAAIFLIPDEVSARHAATHGQGPPDGGRAEWTPGSRSDTTARERDPAVWLGMGLLAVGAVWLMTLPMRSGLGFGFGLRSGGELIWALLLIGIGVALWRRNESPTRRPLPPPPGATSAGTTTTGATTTGATNTGATAAGATRGPAWQPPPLPAPRPRSILGQVTLGLALTVAGLLWALQLAGVLFPTPGQIVSAALLVIGLGLLVGAFAGRARWLVLVGMLLTPIVLASILLRPVGLGPFASWDWRGTGGDLRFAPAHVDALQPEYRMAAGRLVVDLRQLEGPGAGATSIQLGAGEVEVRLPADRSITLDARVGVGVVSVDGQDVGGLGVDHTTILGSLDGPPLDVEVELGVGRVLVSAEQAAVTEPAP